VSVTYLGNPLKALLSEIVNQSFMIRTLEDAGCPLEGAHIPLIKLGRGNDDILVMSGFGLQDYRITNTLALMAMARCSSSMRVLPTFTVSMLSRWSIYILPMANPWVFNSWPLLRNFEGLYDADEEGNVVIHDALTLRGRSARAIHELVNSIKPKLILLVRSGDNDNTSIANVADLGGFNTTEPRPWYFGHHFTLEGYPTLDVVISEDHDQHEMALRILNLVRDYEINWRPHMYMELRLRIHGDADRFMETMRMHGIEVEDGPGLVILKGSNYLTEYLSRLIEYYFDVELLT